MCDTTQYVCDTIPMCMILSHGVILSCGVGTRRPDLHCQRLLAIFIDHNRRIIHNLCLFVVSNGAIRDLLFVLLFQNRAWLVVDYQNVQKYKQCQFATYTSKLNAPLHYCCYLSDDNC